MKIKVLFAGFCFCFTAQFSYGQTETQTLKEPIPVAVSANPVLNAQRAKLDSKQFEINQAVSSSRAQMNKLTEEFRVLKEEYRRLLSAELEKTMDMQLKAQLQEEITRYLVTNSQTR